MLAQEIRAAVEEQSLRHDPSDIPRLRRELPVSMGVGRIDVAVINGSLRGFEIKSAADGLSRLARQVDVYSRVVDEAVLVIEREHPRRLLSRLPLWWGLWAARAVDGRCTLEQLRAPRANPQLDPLATAQMLWRDEALTLLRQHGHGRGLSGANRWRLWTTIIDVIPFDELQRHVRATLKARPEW